MRGLLHGDGPKGAWMQASTPSGHTALGGPKWDPEVPSQLRQSVNTLKVASMLLTFGRLLREF